MSREYTTTELERMVQGVPHEPNVVFYEQSKMDPDLSKAANKRVYKTVLMVKYTQPGVTDWAPARAQTEDIKAHPEEYQQFLDTRDDVGSPSVEIIPGITQDEAQELIDYGLTTITKLCEALTLPEHLTHVQQSAIRINEVLKHEQQANEESNEEEGETEITEPGYQAVSTEESGSEGSSTGGTHGRGYVGNRSLTKEAQHVSETDRPIDATDERRPELSASNGVDAGSATERPHKGGRINGGQRIGSDWSISVDVR